MVWLLPQTGRRQLAWRPWLKNYTNEHAQTMDNPQWNLAVDHRQEYCGFEYLKAYAQFLREEFI